MKGWWKFLVEDMQLMASEKVWEEFISFSAAVSSCLMHLDRAEQNILRQLLCPSVVGQPSRLQREPSPQLLY